MGKDIPKYSIYFWPGYFLYAGRVTDNSEHMHHALQVILDREGLFQVRIGEASIECGGIVIGPDCRHQLLSSSESQVHLLIDSGTDIAEAIAKAHLGEGKTRILEGVLLRKLRGCIDRPGNLYGSCAQAREVFRRLVAELGDHPLQPEEAIDSRILTVKTLLRGKYLSRKVAVAELAQHACLSESRFIHLFTQEVGIPLRRYVLWLRLMAAVQFAAQGESLTEAAHYAGFADSAHLSRTFRMTFGLTLSVVLKNSRFVQVISCLS